MSWLKKLFSKPPASAPTISPAAPADTPQSTGGGNEPYLGDLEKTGVLFQLFAIPREQRDERWLAAFYAAAPMASFRAGDPQVHVGPDGFPYFVLLLPEPGKSFQCYVLTHMARDFLLAQGLGVVVEPGNGQPQWVLSHGDIVQLALLSSLEPQPASVQSSGREQLSAAEQVLVGQPSETLLPLVTRNVLRNYFSQHGVPDIQICLMSRMTPSGPDQSIVFDATPERFQSEEHYQGVMQSLAWFLPRHYRYSAMARSSLANGFLPL